MVPVPSGTRSQAHLYLRGAMFPGLGVGSKAWSLQDRLLLEVWDLCPPLIAHSLYPLLHQPEKLELPEGSCGICTSSPAPRAQALSLGASALNHKGLSSSLYVRSLPGGEDAT